MFTSWYMYIFELKNPITMKTTVLTLLNRIDPHDDDDDFGDVWC